MMWELRENFPVSENAKRYSYRSSSLKTGWGLRVSWVGSERCVGQHLRLDRCYPRKQDSSASIQESVGTWQIYHQGE